MEKRRSKRILLSMDTMIVSRSLNLKGKIKDIAEDGVCIHIHTEQNVCQLLNGMLFCVNISLPSGAKMDFPCEVVRTHRQTGSSCENIVGMRIISQPPEYREFLDLLR